ALPFHEAGRLTWNLIGGALGSTGLMSPSTLQYSPTAATPAPAAGTTSVPVTTAPEVGRPISAAATVNPFSSAQDFAWGAGAGAGAGVATGGELWSSSSSLPQPPNVKAVASAVNSDAAWKRRTFITPLLVPVVCAKKDLQGSRRG